MRSTPIRITANGQIHELTTTTSVSDFLSISGWKPTQVVVEHNGTVLDRVKLSEIHLEDGDCLEIIIPVAGG